MKKLFASNVSAAKIGTMQKISMTLHHLSSHAVPAVNLRWKKADERFRKAHSCKLLTLSRRGVIRDKF